MVQWWKRLQCRIVLMNDFLAENKDQILGFMWNQCFFFAKNPDFRRWESEEACQEGEDRVWKRQRRIIGSDSILIVPGIWKNVGLILRQMDIDQKSFKWTVQVLSFIHLSSTLMVYLHYAKFSDDTLDLFSKICPCIILWSFLLILSSFTCKILILSKLIFFLFLNWINIDGIFLTTTFF